MLDDDRNRPDPGTDPSPDRPLAARTRARGASMGVLACLMAGTCWVVASLASAWLVPPYLILMAWILLPAARPSGGPAGVEADPADTLGPALPTEGLAGSPDPEASTAPAVPPGDPESAPAPAPAPTRARRGKGKARKAKPTPEPGEATWVEVAPGKFVRAEAPQARAEAGPHDFMGVPAEVLATPPSQDPAEPASDVSPAFDPVEGWGFGPDGGVVGSGPAEPLEVEEAGDRAGEVGGIPAVDGIAPQADDTFDDPEADRPGSDPGASEGRGWAESGAEESPEPGLAPTPEGLAPGSMMADSIGLAREPVDEAGPVEWEPAGSEGGPTPRAETPEVEGSPEEPEAPDDREAAEVAEAPEVDLASPPGGAEATDPPPLADPAPEDQGVWRTDDDGPDPTETAVDETVLDDAGPCADDLGAPEALMADDSPEPDAPPGVPEGSAWWPRRLSPRALTRVGPDPRATPNATPPRRPVRSLGAARRPPGPRRPRRRGHERHREGTRTFPPRSPPRGASVGGRG